MNQLNLDEGLCEQFNSHCEANADARLAAIAPVAASYAAFGESQS